MPEQTQPGTNGHITVTTAGTPVAFGSGAEHFRTICLIGYKTTATRTLNTGTVYIQVASAAGAAAIPMAPGAVLTIEAPDGYFFKMENFYLDAATNGDGVDFLTW